MATIEHVDAVDPDGRSYRLREFDGLLQSPPSSWTREGRVVLVVVERPGEQQHLFLDHFFLLTSASVKEESADSLLARYRQRGTAEADFGDCNTALSPALSSAPRSKSHYRGHVVREPYPVHDGFAANEAELLLSLLAANLMAIGAEVLHAEGTRPDEPCIGSAEIGLSSGMRERHFSPERAAWPRSPNGGKNGENGEGSEVHGRGGDADPGGGPPAEHLELNEGL